MKVEKEERRNRNTKIEDSLWNEYSRVALIANMTRTDLLRQISLHVLRHVKTTDDVRDLFFHKKVS